MLPPTLLNLGFCAPSRQEALGTRSQPSKRSPSFNQLPVLFVMAHQGSHTGLHYEDKAKTKRAEGTGRQYSHRS